MNLNMKNKNSKKETVPTPVPTSTPYNIPLFKDQDNYSFKQTPHKIFSNIPKEAERTV